jgi:N-acetylglucosamine-6-phosphate deacetylase
MTKASAKSLLLTGARVVLPGQVIERGAVLIEDGHIAAVLPVAAADKSQQVEQIDLAGLKLFPGFIDVHIHGAVGVDTMVATAADLGRVSQFLATRGVTGWLPTLVPASHDEYELAINAIAEAMRAQQDEERLGSRGARILGVHYEGPFVNATQCGALHKQFFRSFSGPADLDDLATLDAERGIHLITLAPEIDGGIELVRELRSRGWIVSLGHTRASIEQLDRAAAAGARHMTHFMNAMAPLHHRAPGPVGWGLMRDDVTCDIIADGVHLDRDMLRLLLKLKGADRLSLISDAVAAAGMGDGAYEIWGERITVKDGRTSNVHGTIAGSVITMPDAARMMLSVGASESEVARMAATNPARLLGIDQDYGSIEVGKRADLVAVDSDGEVALTVVGGAVVFNAREQ